MKAYNIQFYVLLVIFLLVHMGTLAQEFPETPILVDQFGYRPADDKVAVVSSPQIGFNVGKEYTPGKLYEVRKASNDEVVFQGFPVVWNKGEIHRDSGDKGWWFDFTEVKAQGDYYIIDLESNVRSFIFHISDDVYKDVLKAAMRVYYYQRVNSTKELPFAEAPWIDNNSWYPQDLHAIDIHGKLPEKDMSKGWMDAGDANKYVTFAAPAVHQLLTSYQDNTSMWTKLELNIPESTNNVPDILDEVKWELDWILKMQDTVDGGVYSKLGLKEHNQAPGTDQRVRYYEQKCSSATISAAGMFAHAYLAMKDIPELKEYAELLKERALMAWKNFSWLNKGTFDLDCDAQLPTGICCGDADKSLEYQKAELSLAAAYLFGVTGTQYFNTEFLKYFQESEHFKSPYNWGEFNNFLADGLSYYCMLPNANTKAVQLIKEKRLTGSKNFKNFTLEENSDLYRAYTGYHGWGSNMPRCNIGNSCMRFIASTTNARANTKYLERALGLLHFIHGVNPLKMTFLTNMKASKNIRYGAEFSVSELFHTWFFEETSFDNTYVDHGPAPGFLAGGPNGTYTHNAKVKLGNTLYESLIKDQPNYKSFSVDNSSWMESVQEVTGMWELNEPGIYYQASYVQLLANFVGKDSEKELEGIANVNYFEVDVPKKRTSNREYAVVVNYNANREAELKAILSSCKDALCTPVDSTAVSVARGNGSTKLPLKIPDTSDLDTTYGLQVSMVEKDSPKALLAPEFVKFIAEDAPSASLKDTGSITKALLPSKVKSGTNLNAMFNYSAAMPTHLFLNVFDTSSGEWKAIGEGVSVDAAADADGTTTLSLPLPKNLRPHDKYIIYLSMFSEDWQTEIFTYPHTNLQILK